MGMASNHVGMNELRKRHSLPSDIRFYTTGAKPLPLCGGRVGVWGIQMKLFHCVIYNKPTPV
jgi:hypothetical protein